MVNTDISNFVRKIIEPVLSAFIFVIIPVISLTVISSNLGLFGFKSFTVQSGSMEPLIPTGSTIYTFKNQNIYKGDIISFERNGINITHRVVEVVDINGNRATTLDSPVNKKNLGEVMYRTKGDANDSVDSELVRNDQVVGKAVIHLPFLGFISATVKSMPGFIILIVIPTFVFIGMELWNIKREIEKETEKKVLTRLKIYG